MVFAKQDDHITHYMVLFVGLFVFVSLFVLFRYNGLLQFGVGVLGCVFYVAWGVLHHVLERRLTKLVLLEYVLFAFLVALLLLFNR